MKNTHGKISFLVNKEEMDLIDEACLCGADADHNLDNAVKEKNKYRLEFSFEELDDLAGYIASCANDEESDRKQAKWDNLCKKIEKLLDKAERRLSSFEEDAPIFLKPVVEHFIFDVWIDDCSNGKVSRKIQIPGTKSLYNFAKVITQAFGFYFDHCFGFYDNFIKNSESKKGYEVFVDVGEEPTSPTFKGTKKAKIQQAFKRPGEKMLFFFDYGDAWRFVVELKEIKDAETVDLKATVIESVGEAPPQYPPAAEEEMPTLLQFGVENSKI